MSKLKKDSDGDSNNSKTSAEKIPAPVNPDSTLKENIAVDKNNEHVAKSSEATGVENKNSTMEVHAGHHKEPGQGWKHYVFEFFMLFLAVTLGFFMENQREHYIEKNRAKLMAQSLFNDLKNDAAYLGELSEQRKRKILTLDSLMNELDKPLATQNDSLLAKLIRPALYNRRYFISELGTYEQIKNSGSLRYYNIELQRSLVNYEVETKGLNIGQDLENKFVMEQIVPFLMTIENPGYFRNLLTNKPPPIGISPFRSTKEFRDDLYNYSVFIRGRAQNLVNIMERVKSKISALIDLLQKEYHLK